MHMKWNIIVYKCSNWDHDGGTLLYISVATGITTGRSKFIFKNI